MPRSPYAARAAAQLSLCPAYPAPQCLYAVAPADTSIERLEQEDFSRGVVRNDVQYTSSYEQARALAQTECVRQRKPFVVLDIHDSYALAYRVHPQEYFGRP